MLQRVIPAGAAVAAAIWIGFGLNSVLLERSAARAGFTSSESLTPAKTAHVIDLLERARAHNPDSRPTVDEAALLARVGRKRTAVALLRDVVDKEPDNFTAWRSLAEVAAGVDPALAARAGARARELNPPVAPAR